MAGPELRRRGRVGVRVEGVVQGVGFRPYVHALATGLGLVGHVGNDGGGVFIEVEGDGPALDRFLDRLPREAPPLAAIERVTTADLPATGDDGFTIVASAAGDGARTPVGPDVATCDACLAEVRDPHDRRHRYPFTNCTDCGPRYTIVRDVPYDRARTTMAGFAMCDDCAREYHDPADRRFHAQPLCCPACGPRLRLVTRDGAGVAGDPLAAAAARLRHGEVLAVKGLGGYHLAALASHEAAVTALRARKHREDKPFAVMVADLAAARRLCQVDADDAVLLADRARPIVLLPRRPDADVAGAVAPGNRALGLMLPYTPLHHLLLAEVGAPLVMTSGNRSDEPIAHRDDDAAARLGAIADAFLVHDRPIHVRADDSVVRMIAGRPTPLRRSRGYAPAPLTLPWQAPRPVLAVGAEQKSTVCLATGGRAILSHHLGDLDDFETFRAFEQAIGHLTRLFDLRPAVVAHDLHPDYRSTAWARDLDGVELVGVQHHHAHVAACLADNGEAGPVVGVAFDGTGYGSDGTIWGGEILVADLADAERVGHLAPVPLPGGAAAVRQPWRMAAVHLAAAFGDTPPHGLAVRGRHAERWDDVLAIAAAGVNAPPTSSVGRLFDAVAAILGVRDEVTYEGQAAIELEQRADPGEQRAYPVGIRGGDEGDGGRFQLVGADLVRAVVADLARGLPVASVAARAHHGLAAAVVAACERVRADRGLETVALSGGVFQNVLLTERTVRDLAGAGFRVLTHHRVPPNDGGISLGQAVVAAARDRRGRAPAA
jgi:hydrogenase maturation protein HypF